MSILPAAAHTPRQQYWYPPLSPFNSLPHEIEIPFREQVAEYQVEVFELRSALEEDSLEILRLKKQLSMLTARHAQVLEEMKNMQDLQALQPDQASAQDAALQAESEAGTKGGLHSKYSPSPLAGHNDPTSSNPYRLEITCYPSSDMDAHRPGAGSDNDISTGRMGSWSPGLVVSRPAASVVGWWILGSITAGAVVSSGLAAFAAGSVVAWCMLTGAVLRS